MNDIWKKRTENVIKSLEELQEKATDLQHEISEIYNGEQATLDDMPISLQDTDRYAESEQACDSLNAAKESFDELQLDFFALIDSLKEIVN